MPRLSDFRMKTDSYPVVSSGQADTTGKPGGDELIIVHREPLAIQPVVFIGCHTAGAVEVYSAQNTTDLESAAAWTTLNLEAGHKTRINLPGTGSPFDQVTKIKPIGAARIFVAIASFGEFETYFRQVTVY